MLSSFKMTTATPKPGSPLYKVSDTAYVEGYWASLHPEYDTENTREKYNLPISTKMPVDPKFLSKLKKIMIKHESSAVSFRGLSDCRVCSKMNGSKEFTLTNSQISFTFPEGIIHYYKDHGVQPSDKFHDFIVGFE